MWKLVSFKLVIVLASFVSIAHAMSLIPTGLINKKNKNSCMNLFIQLFIFDPLKYLILLLNA